VAYYPSLSVSVGAYTKASDYNHAADSLAWLQQQGDVGHDFDPDTGDGFHRGSWQAPLVLKASASLFAALWLDNTDPGRVLLRRKTGSTAAAAMPSSITDGEALQTAVTGSPPPGFPA
jgi:hypothetical protein